MLPLLKRGHVRALQIRSALVPSLIGRARMLSILGRVMLAEPVRWRDRSPSRLSSARPRHGGQVQVAPYQRLSCIVDLRNDAVESCGRFPIPARRQPTVKSDAICSARIPSPVMRVCHLELLSLPLPRKSRMRPRIFSFRAGKCSSSQCSKSGATAHGKRTMV